MRVRDIMSQQVASIAPDAGAQHALERMHAVGVRHLVVQRGPEVVGMVSEVDLGGELARAERTASTVQDVMTKRVLTLEPDATIRAAANRMRGSGVGSLVVMHAGELVGIVTVSDLLDFLGRGGLQRPVERKTIYRKDRPSTPESRRS